MLADPVNMIGKLVYENDYIGMVVGYRGVDSFSVEWYSEVPMLEHELNEEFIVDRRRQYLEKFSASSSVG